MRYIIFGASRIGRAFYKALSETSKDAIAGFCDNDPQKQEETVDGKSIRPIQAYHREDVCFLLAMQGHPMMDAYGTLRKEREDTWSVRAITDWSMAPGRDLRAATQAINLRLPVLEYVETDIVTHCNLKCKNCGHLSDQLPPSFVDVAGYERDVARLAELYSGCTRFRIMGGEPLLHPEIVRLAQAVRRHLPMANLRIVTNGLLIPKLSDEKLQGIHDAGAEFDITQYPPTAKILPDIEARLEAFGIRYHVSALVDRFYAFEAQRPADPVESYQHCMYPHCHSMQSGYIAVCGVGLFAKRMADFLGRDISEEEVERNRIDLYDKSLTGERLSKMLRSPIPACRYCGVEPPPLVPWESRRESV